MQIRQSFPKVFHLLYRKFMPLSIQRVISLSAICKLSPWNKFSRESNYHSATDMMLSYHLLFSNTWPQFLRTQINRLKTLVKLQESNKLRWCSDCSNLGNEWVIHWVSIIHRILMSNNFYWLGEEWQHSTLEASHTRRSQHLKRAVSDSGINVLSCSTVSASLHGINGDNSQVKNKRNVQNDVGEQLPYSNRCLKVIPTANKAINSWKSVKRIFNSIKFLVPASNESSFIKKINRTGTKSME